MCVATRIAAKEKMMPRFREVGPEARERLVRSNKGYQQRQVYRDNLGRLGEGRIWEVAPESGETLRKIKVNVRRAANELSMNIGYGETPEGLY
jgi:hypothetical protein